MNCKIHIHLLNELFSQELADAQHNGKETADNLRYEWEDELEITSEVTKMGRNEASTITNVLYPLGTYQEISIMTRVGRTLKVIQTVKSN